MKKELRIERLLEKKITDKGDISRDYMVAYVVTFGNSADKNWLAEMIRTNVVVRKNNVRGGTYRSIDLAEVREAFCIRFKDFYALSDDAKKEARKNEDIFGSFLAEYDIDLADDNNVIHLTAVGQ